MRPSLRVVRERDTAKCEGFEPVAEIGALDRCS
jgi:hypothetical protein